MIYLLDVNVLLALGYGDHVHHARVARWLRSLPPQGTRLATCAITELGFVRVASGPCKLSDGVAAAREGLLRLQAAREFLFLSDALDAECLPSWVQRSKQTNDGHLVKLATTHAARFATLDTGIPAAELIPDWPAATGVREEAAAYGMVA